MAIAHKKEADFIQRIDCKFPYHDLVKATHLIEEAQLISPNAVFKVVEELVRIPEGKREIVSTSTLNQLLNQSLFNYKHPLSGHLYPICLLMINEQEIASSESLLVMSRVKAFPGQYAALSIVYHAVSSSTPELEHLYEEIIQAWKTNAKV